MAAVIPFRSPVIKPLLRSYEPPCEPRTSCFRVTQQFSDPDFYWGGDRTHQAVDIGDFSCGSEIVAMGAGSARRTFDNAMDFGAPNNALGVVIDHGHGLSTEYWHLAGWVDLPVNGSVEVEAGRQIGVVGNTGLGQICHCHIELKLHGVKQDPEPHMFGVPYVVPTPETAMEAADMIIVIQAKTGNTWLFEADRRTFFALGPDKQSLMDSGLPVITVSDAQFGLLAKDRVRIQ